MDYCHPCQPHLNGALICPGCGTPAEACRAYAESLAASPARAGGAGADGGDDGDDDGPRSPRLPPDAGPGTGPGVGCRAPGATGGPHGTGVAGSGPC